MSATTRKEKTGTCHTENISGENQQSLGGGEENGLQNLARRKTDCANESHDRSSQLLGMCMPKTADLRHFRRS